MVNLSQITQKPELSDKAKNILQEYTDCCIANAFRCVQPLEDRQRIEYEFAEAASVLEDFIIELEVKVDIDFHIANAAILFNVKPEDVTPAMLNIAKEWYHIKHYTPTRAVTNG